MVLLRQLYKLTLVILLTAIKPAQAAPVYIPEASYRPVEREEARYDLIVNGLKIGHFFLWWEETPTTYKATFSMKTSGLVRFFRQQDRYAVTTGIIKRENGQVMLLPQHFSSESKTRRKTRLINITYDKEGNPVEVAVNPPDNPKTRPAVSSEGRNSAYDPLTGVQMLYAMAAEKKTDAAFSVFDGRRLTQILFGSATENPFACKACPLFSLSRKPLEGFDDGDLADYKKGDPPLRIIIDPAQSRLPASARADLSWGVLTAKRN